MVNSREARVTFSGVPGQIKEIVAGKTSGIFTVNISDILMTTNLVFQLIFSRLGAVNWCVTADTVKVGTDKLINKFTEKRIPRYT